ncbi:uncharacterized protein AB675_7267 [Cyphellophora attinorum]|uniref:Uncharacterized protein n=1 Tax=Cyphellophora attinorum TaxID=1664694 RepID=A0A0N1GZ17_9EURO|nr:uncharacterized protein AB675_7267 [Phialophora attinorum]KPI36235.1 hypothetical protein AB675_7267 [Phialophora attinorum]
MAADRSKISKRLTDLPSEILRAIFKEAFRDFRVACGVGRQSGAIMIALPPSLIVSHTYFAEAKDALLQHATIEVGSISASMHPLAPTIPVSPDFGLVQYLIASSHPTGMNCEALKAAIQATPRLQMLVVDAASAMFPRNTDPLNWQFNDTAGAANNRGRIVTGKLSPEADNHIKAIFERLLDVSVGLGPHGPMLDGDLLVSGPHIEGQTAAALKTWLARNRGFELCIEMSVVTPGLPAGLKCQLWIATFSTRTHVLTIRAGKDNYIESSPDTCHKVSMDPSMLDRAVNKLMGRTHSHETINV